MVILKLPMEKLKLQPRRCRDGDRNQLKRKDCPVYLPYAPGGLLEVYMTGGGGGGGDINGHTNFISLLMQNHDHAFRKFCLIE